MKKKAGIGRWAIGGTSLVYKYNTNYWDQTYEKGNGQYDVLGGPDRALGPEGRDSDIYGFQDMNTGDNQEGGYDFKDNNDED